MIWSLSLHDLLPSPGKSPQGSLYILPPASSPGRTRRGSKPRWKYFFCVSGHAFITSLWWDSVLPDVQSTKETHYCHMFLGSWLFGYNSHSITTSGDSKKHIYLLVKWGLCVLTFFPLNNNGSLQMCRFFFYFKIPSTLTCFLKIVQPHMTENFVLTVLC